MQTSINTLAVWNVGMGSVTRIALLGKRPSWSSLLRKCVVSLM